MDWTNVGRGVEQLVELIDDDNANHPDYPFRNPNHFGIDRIDIQVKDSSIRAYDRSNKCFKYAIYVSGSGELIADGS